MRSSICRACMDIEPMRSVPVRLRAGHRSRTLAITGLPRTPHLNRVVDRGGRALSLPDDGLVLSRMLADILDVAPGQSLQVEVLEGEQPVRDVPVVALVDDSHGASGLHADRRRAPADARRRRRSPAPR